MRGRTKSVGFEENIDKVEVVKSAEEAVGEGLAD